MTASHTGGYPAPRHGGDDVATGPRENSGQVGPHWDVRVGRGGKLTATLVGTQPPIVLTAEDEESLRKQVKTLIMRAML